MYQVLAFLDGVLLAVMVISNGELSAVYGSFLSSVISRIVGGVVTLGLCCWMKAHIPRGKRLPPWMYMGGVYSVAIVLLNNLAFGKISMTSIFALGLLGQTLTSLVIDLTGALGMERRPFQKSSLAGLVIAAAGIAVMMDNTVTAAAIAVVLSILAGAATILSRTINASLSREIGKYQSSLMNYLIGFPISLALAAVVLAGSGMPEITAGAGNPWIYCGGVIGVVTLLICNVAVPQMSSFLFTLLALIGQILTGVVLDLLLGKGYSGASFYGGLIIAFAVAVSMVLERMEDRKNTQV